MIDGSPGAIERAIAAADEFPDHPFVQYQLGLALASRKEHRVAARAFERAIAADRQFAYAYYQSGLAHHHEERLDVTAARFETFVKLAPEAPERPEVETILRTIR